jgi:hypothetical protein
MATTHTPNIAPLPALSISLSRDYTSHLPPPPHPSNICPSSVTLLYSTPPLLLHPPCPRPDPGQAPQWARLLYSRLAYQSPPAPQPSSRPSCTPTLRSAAGAACRLLLCPSPQLARTTPAPARGPACPATPRVTTAARPGEATTRESKPLSRRPSVPTMQASTTSMPSSRTFL